ncbi:MAG: hypothetical protein LBC77_06255 [Spirochaetaceae bacterium]|jgi:hypothetical protein|nr:hypothetical protein [Spirochaetaceae bacterium]
MFSKLFRLTLPAAFALCAALPDGVFAQEEGQTPAYVVNAIQENCDTFRWLNIINTRIVEDVTSAPVIRLNRFRYDRGIVIAGSPLKAEVMHLLVITDGKRYEFTFDFFDSPRREKDAYRTSDAHRVIFPLLAGVFPGEFTGEKAEKKQHSVE